VCQGVSGARRHENGALAATTIGIGWESIDEGDAHVRPGDRANRERGVFRLLAWTGFVVSFVASACHAAPTPVPEKNPPHAGAHEEPAPPQPSENDRAKERKRMVEKQLMRREIQSRSVLDTMMVVPRHAFIPEENREHAYEDRPVSIGHQQTISQPYIVAYMTEALAPKSDQRVLEIGTGSGYQAAILAELMKEVYTIEIIAPLGERAREVLDELDYKNIHFRIGDGYAGWAEAAPFDAVILTAAPPEIPQPLLDQLKIGGVLLAPVGRNTQGLVRMTRTAEGYSRERLLGVRFVPMTGRAQEP